MSRIVKIGFVGLVLVIGALIITSQSGVKSALQEVDADHVFSLLDQSGAEFDSVKGKKAVASAFAYLEKFGVTPYDFGHHLHLKGEGDRAVLWYQNVGIATDDPQFFYGRAFQEWRLGDTEAALRDVNFLIQKDLSPLIKARTYYLKGRMSLQSRFLKEAESDFSIAHDSYKSIDGKFGGQFLCLSLLARIAIYKKEYDRVEPILTEALEARRKGIELGLKLPGMGSIYEIYGEMYFEKREFKTSLEENLKSREAYLQNGREASAEVVLIKIGLLEFINGNPKAAYDIATGVRERLINTPKTRLLAYNSVTLAMLSLCSNQIDDFNLRKQTALSWAKTDAGGQDLIDLMTFLEHEIPCPELKE